MELLKVFLLILIISVVIDMRQYISRRKILHKMNEVCGAISHKMDKLTLRKHQVDGTQLLIYIYIHVHVYILPYLHQNKMIKIFGSLLQCIGQNFCMNFIECIFYRVFYFVFQCCLSIVYTLLF